MTWGPIGSFPCNGMITVNRAILRTGHSADARQARIADRYENGKTYQPNTGFIGGFVASIIEEVSGPQREIALIDAG